MRKKMLVTAVIFSALVFSSCNFPLLANKEPDEIDLLGTSVAETIQAMNGQPSATQPPNEQPTAEPGFPTVPPQLTQPVGPQPTSAVNPCNKAVFLTETIPDDSEFAPGQTFTKSWTFDNKGTCTWNTNYKLAFSTGEAMGGPKSVSVPINVAPNTQIKIDVPLKAPDTPGTYTGYWELQTPEGEGFFQVYVRIKVAVVTFAVTRVQTNLANVSPAACPTTYGVDISITTNAAGKVTYRTETNTGEVSALKSLDFTSAGTKVVEFDWANLGVGGAKTDYWLKVYIGTPNNQTFGPYYFSVTCP
jgi:hypothetical protein